MNIIVLDGILYDNLINKQCLYNWNIMKNRFWCEYFFLILEKNLHMCVMCLMIITLDSFIHVHMFQRRMA